MISPLSYVNLCATFEGPYPRKRDILERFEKTLKNIFTTCHSLKSITGRYSALYRLLRHLLITILGVRVFIPVSTLKMMMGLNHFSNVSNIHFTLLRTQSLKNFQLTIFKIIKMIKNFQEKNLNAYHKNHLTFKLAKINLSASDKTCKHRRCVLFDTSKSIRNSYRNTLSFPENYYTTPCSYTEAYSAWEINSYVTPSVYLSFSLNVKFYMSCTHHHVGPSYATALAVELPCLRQLISKRSKLSRHRYSPACLKLTF